MMRNEINNLDEILKFINKEFQSKKLKANDVALKTGLAESTISRIRNKVTKPDIDTLFKILKALEIKLYIKTKNY